MKSPLFYGAQCLLLVFIDMKTRNFGRPPYVEVYALLFVYVWFTEPPHTA